MKTVNVSLGERSYPISIGAGALKRAELYRSHITGPQAVVITDENVAPLYLDTLVAAIGGMAEVHACILPAGEKSKNLDAVSRIIDEMMRRRCARDTTVVALGGGVVGDIAGFAAACYHRGVPFIQVPTTLVAQVDSSVGGKTGVNHAQGKNMIGAFHQPRCVIADTDTLKTLPVRETRSGIAEIIKYGAICDLALFEWLESDVESLAGLNEESVAHAIERSCLDKARIVAEDERETGFRALLNFGHTFGHAIETAVGYEGWLHGEAVAVGMSMAADFSRRMDLLKPDEVVRLDALIRRAGLPSFPPPNVTPDEFLDLMRGDKKVKAGSIRLVALESIGSAVIVDKDHMAALEATLRAALPAD